MTGLLGSAQGLLQSTPGRQAASAGTGMLFALRSMANRMSPVLSSCVSHRLAENQSVIGQSSHGQGMTSCHVLEDTSYKQDSLAILQL